MHGGNGDQTEQPLNPARGARVTLRVLHLEDSEPDHELVLAHLLRAGLHVDAVRVETEAAFRDALLQPWDVILSDYNLPGFSGVRALEIVREARVQAPFILVSGEIGEDVAVSAMRNGAADYLLKNRLARLAPALEHALAAARLSTEKARADDELMASREELSKLAQHLQTSIEAERAAIAREIHDDVGGTLTAIKLELAWMNRQPEVPPQLRERLGGMIEAVTHALEASQRIMHNLRPAILEQGLVAALQWMTQRFEKRNRMPCAFSAAPEPQDLAPAIALTTYRTAQEALTNISKHAGASRVSVDLAFVRGVLSLEICDDGRGLAEGDLRKASSFGLRGLKERAGTVGGWVELSSSPAGTTLILSIPLAASTPSAAQQRQPPEHDDMHDPSAWGTL